MDFGVIFSYVNLKCLLTASISGSNFVGVHWISNVVNFVIDIIALIAVQNIIPHTMDELQEI